MTPKRPRAKKLRHVAVRVVPGDCADACQCPGWDILRGGKWIAFHFRKASAVLAARQVAGKDVLFGRTVSLRICGRNGRVQEERTYPRSADKCPPRG